MAEEDSGRAAGWRRQQRSSRRQHAKVTLRREVFFEIRTGVAERDQVFLQQRVHVETRPEAKHPPDLLFAEGAGAVTLDRDGFERPARTSSQRSPSAAETSAGSWMVTVIDR